MSVASQYRELLVKFVPRPIHSDREHRRALAALEQLMIPRPGAAQSQLIEVLSTLIEQYESSLGPRLQVSPARVLEHLIVAKGIRNSELAKATGIPSSTLTNVLHNRREISKANAVRLARYFRVSPSIFLSLGETEDSAVHHVKLAGRRRRAARAHSSG